MYKQKKMSSSHVEHIRQCHADIEKASRNIVAELQKKAKTQKGNILQQHRINNYLNEIQVRSKEAYTGFADKDGLLRAEMDSMSFDSLDKTLASFDTRLAEVREYHRQFGHSATNLTPASQRELEEDEQAVTVDFALGEDLVASQFSGEEMYGKFVDLHAIYNEYVNMKQFQNQKGSGMPVDYITFLETFHLFHLLSREQKDENYRRYLVKLLTYFESFYKRAVPLDDIAPRIEKITSDFEEKWEKGEVLGWQQQQPNSNNSSNKQQQQQPSEDAMDEVDGDDGDDGDAQAKQQQNGNKKQQQNSNSNNTNNNTAAAAKKKRRRRRGKAGSKDSAKAIALLEAKISQYVEWLSDKIAATRLNIEKKQTRTWEETQAEIEREEEMKDDFAILEKNAAKNAEGEDDDDMKGALGSNPLNLPLGWDGKPIPYWLYKLHGLGIEYRCEICGNHSYWGPRAFERHFQEWRHAFGMRCLKIPNTRHFHHVTKIAEALELWDKLKRESNIKNWKQDAEEFEDDQGNVFNKKTYDDLKRQGLLS